jgi:hypothetical protein
MSTKKNQCQHQAKSQNPFATLIECVGASIAAVAMVPALIVDAVVSSVTS